MNRLLSRILLIFCLMLPIAASAQTPAGLTIRMLDPLPASIESFYYRVAVGYPPMMGDGAFHFYVNGKDAAFEPIASDSAAEENPRAFRIYLGEPGHKRLEVSLTKNDSTLRGVTELDFHSKGGMILMGFYDGMSLFDTEEISILAYFMRDARIAVNGRAIRAQSEAVEGMEGVSRLTFMPELRSGTNVIEYSGIGYDGKPFARSFSIFMIQNGKVKVGDQISYVFGYQKTNEADPEFSLHITGTALVETGSPREVVLQGLSETSWLTEQSIFVQPIVAREAGASTLEVTARYSTGFQNKTDTVITVEPTNPPPSAR